MLELSTSYVVNSASFHEALSPSRITVASVSNNGVLTCFCFHGVAYLWYRSIVRGAYDRTFASGLGAALISGCGKQ